MRVCVTVCVCVCAVCVCVSLCVCVQSARLKVHCVCVYNQATWRIKRQPRGPFRNVPKIQCHYIIQNKLVKKKYIKAKETNSFFLLFFVFPGKKEIQEGVVCAPKPPQRPKNCTFFGGPRKCLLWFTGIKYKRTCVCNVCHCVCVCVCVCVIVKCRNSRKLFFFSDDFPLFSFLLFQCYSF